MTGETLFALLCWTGIAIIGLCWWFEPLEWWRCRRWDRPPGFEVVRRDDSAES